VAIFGLFGCEVMAGEVLDIAVLNRAVWSREETVAHFSRLAGFIDPGERAALAAVAPRVRGAPVLDLGVGAGRTVPLLRLLTDDYVAVDYSPAMVSACHRLNPGVDVRAGDVRDLSEFQDGRFGLVFFSFSGIDAVSHADRARALREMLRVLRPGGWVVFSTHNLEGPSYGEVPWRGYRRGGSRLYRTVRWILRLPFDLPRHARRWRNWWRRSKAGTARWPALRG